MQPAAGKPPKYAGTLNLPSCARSPAVLFARRHHSAGSSRLLWVDWKEDPAGREKQHQNQSLKNSFLLPHLLGTAGCCPSSLHS